MSEHPDLGPPFEYWLRAGGVREGEASDLDEGAVGWWPDAEGFDARSGGEAMGRRGASFFAGCGVVELDDEIIFAALPAKNIVASGKRDAADGDGSLDKEVVRVFSIGGVAGSDENDAGDDLAWELMMPEAVRISVSMRSFSTWARAGNALCNSAAVAERHVDLGCAWSVAGSTGRSRRATASDLKGDSVI